MSGRTRGGQRSGGRSSAQYVADAYDDQDPAPVVLAADAPVYSAGLLLQAAQGEQMRDGTSHITPLFLLHAINHLPPLNSTISILSMFCVRLLCRTFG